MYVTLTPMTVTTNKLNVKLTLPNALNPLYCLMRTVTVKLIQLTSALIRH